MAQFIDFGTGREGSLNISAANLGGIAGFGVATVTGTAGQYSCVKTDCGYFNTVNGGRDGDMVMIHQSQGTGAGQWEVNYIVSTSGTTVNLLYPLTYTYVAGAQMCTSPQLYNGTISGNLTQYANWAGSFGGIIFLVDKGTLTISGTIKVEGVIGSTFVSQNGRAGGATGGGFRGGNSFNPSNTSDAYANTGEGYTGASYVGLTANGNGGGGAHTGGDWGAGSGGGNGTAGTAGNNSGGTDSVGGTTAGNEALTNMVFGGGGGGTVKGYSYNVVGGSSGGGIIFIIAKNIIVNNSISVNGGHGGWWDTTIGIGSGAGAGGSILIKCQTANLGSNVITAAAGVTGLGSQSNGGAAGVGRIRIDYKDSITGSITNPNASTYQDSSLKSQVYSGMI